VDQQLSWALQVNKTKMKMAGALASIRKYKEYFTTNLLKTVIQTLVLSHLDYGLVLTSSSPQTHLDKLQVIQNRAARLATGACFDANLDVLHNQLNWPSVKERLFTGTINIFHKVVKEKQPKCIFSRLKTVNTAHSHNTRLAQKGAFLLPKPRTNAITRTFLYRAIKTYNTLPIHITSSNPRAFKVKIWSWTKTQRHKNSPISSWW